MRRLAFRLRRRRGSGWVTGHLHDADDKRPERRRRRPAGAGGVLEARLERLKRYNPGDDLFGKAIRRRH